MSKENTECVSHNDSVNPDAAQDVPCESAEFGGSGSTHGSATCDLRFNPYEIPLDFISEPTRNIAYKMDIIDMAVFLCSYLETKKTGYNLPDLLHVCFRAAKDDDRFSVDEDGTAHFSGADRVRQELIDELVVVKK